MKRILLAACCICVVLFESCSGCKEIGPSVNLTPSTASGPDSFYTLTGAELAGLTTDPHNVLVEEFSGQMCINCPSASATLQSIAAASPGRVNVVSFYIFGLPQTDPPTGALFDFRDSVATEVSAKIFGGIGQLPSGGIDRLLGTNSKIETSRGLWSGNIEARKLMKDSLNLTVTSSFDKATMTAKIVATVTYTENITAKQNLTVVLVESGMVDKQEAPGGIKDDYEFHHVFRGMISTPYSGDAILDTIATKNRGMVLRRTFSYKLKSTTPAINPDNCHVIAYVNSTNGGNLTMMQSADAKLVP